MCWPLAAAAPARSWSRRAAPAGGGSGGRYGCGLFGFLVRAKVMTAHKLPPAAIHRHTAVSEGPRTKTKAARVHRVIAELAMTTQDSNRITILTLAVSPNMGRPAEPARRLAWVIRFHP